MKPALNRRDWLKATAGAFTAPAFLRARNLNERLDIAVIGTGGRGASNLDAVSSENIVALCDVYEPALERAGGSHPKARKERDFRRLFDDANDFDAVVVSTTEHTHAFAVLPALRLGKHVYCEKPLSHDVYEARLIREAAAKAKVATQMGTQIHAGDNYRRVVELVKAGAVGPVSEVHVLVGRAWGRQPEADAKKNDIVVSLERPSGSSPIPKGLDWDLWIGPAPDRPFHEIYFPGPKWYRWWDFGNGTMSDLGSHWIDLPFWALDLDAPRTIQAFGPPPHPEIAPASMRAVYEYAARGDRPALTLTWYQGSEKPEAVKAGTIPSWDSGVLFVGTDGRMLLSEYGRHVLLPEGRFKDYKRPEPTIPASIGHHAEWIRACKTGEPTTCRFDYSGPLTEANHLGNVAYRAGKKLQWDAAAMKAVNAPEADPYLKREYRKGWSLA